MLIILAMLQMQCSVGIQFVLEKLELIALTSAFSGVTSVSMKNYHDSLFNLSRPKIMVQNVSVSSMHGILPSDLPLNC